MSGAEKPADGAFLLAARERLDALLRAGGFFDDPFGFFEEFDALDAEPDWAISPAGATAWSPFAAFEAAEDAEAEDVALFLQSGQDFEL